MSKEKEKKAKKTKKQRKEPKIAPKIWPFRPSNERRQYLYDGLGKIRGEHSRNKFMELVLLERIEEVKRQRGGEL